jgi:hypothetical protein
MVAHHYFFDGDNDDLFSANTRNWNEDFAITFWSIESSLLEELEDLIAKI